MLTRTALRIRTSNVLFRSRQSIRRFSETVKEAPKEAQAPPQAPPPPQDGGGGGGLIVVAALAGAGYYFQDDIMKQLGMDTKKGDENNTPAVSEIKSEIKVAEEKLEKVAQTPTEQPKQSVQATPAATPVVAAPASSEPVDWDKVRAAIVDLLEEDSYDDGSYGPVLVRLAWHSAGTFDKESNTGGTEGAGMRYANEAGWGANAGLDVARALLEPVKAQFPNVSYSDLWSFAGTVAIEEMGGPEFKWRPGRKDLVEGPSPLPDGRLPDADGREHTDKPANHLREIFNRMGFNDREIVCLSGAHALGRCHTDRSGFWGPWTRAPTTFSNEYFRLLLEERWSKKRTHLGREWTGPEQYEDPTGELMMLPTDLSLVWDEKMRPFVEMYAKDEDLFVKDFQNAWIKLQELGVKRFHGRRRYYFFGPRE